MKVSVLYLTGQKVLPKPVCLLAVKIYLSPKMLLYLVSFGVSTIYMPSYYLSMVSSSLVLPPLHIERKGLVTL